MPWQQNNSGGGGQNPWGSPNGNSGGNSGGQRPSNNGGSPWGGSSGGSGGNSPMRSNGGGGGSMPNPANMGRLIFFGVIALFVIILGYNTIYTVEQGRQAVVMRFGEVNRVEGTGLKFKFPNPIERAAIVDVANVRETSIGFDANGRDIISESLMLTGDQNIVDVDANIQWRADNSRDFLFNVRDPELTVKIAAESALREVVGRTPIQQALSVGRRNIEVDTRVLLQQTLDEYQAGISIDEVQLQNVQAPVPVKQAFDDVQKAQQDRDKAANRAETYRNKVIPEARGQAELINNTALAYYENETKRAQGDAQRFLELLIAYQDNPEVTRERIYLDTMEQVFSNGSTIIMDSNGAGALPLLNLPGSVSNQTLPR